MPKITSHELAEMLRRNPALAKANPALGGPAPTPKPKQIVRDEPLGEASGTQGNTRRFLVRLTAYRVRQLDADNGIGKYFVDCVRRAGIIPDDSASVMDYSIGQHKVAHKSDEKTVIEVFQLT